ncbi:MAG TPA: FHA domain-containing protein [Anaeromyxobacter sp.]|nr:FHA domain-containing protein [Anaeromyxobacter sp.]
MQHRITIDGRDGAEARVLDGNATAGGSRADAIVVPGAPPGAVRLEPCAAGVVVQAAATGVRAAGRALPPGARRLLRPGERLELAGACISIVPPPAPESTRAAAAALLRSAADGAPLPGARLVVLTGRDAGRTLRLGPDQVLGRGRSAALRIPDRLASRRHARVRLGADGARVEDLSSKNGVFVNDVRIEGACALRPGDTLAVGETLLALEDAAGVAVPAPPVPPGSGARPPRAPRVTVRRAAAALLALSAAALALAGS